MRSSGLILISLGREISSLLGCGDGAADFGGCVDRTRANSELGPGAVHRLVRDTQRRYFDPPRFADALSAPRWSR
jgi:hypothetical protein